MLWDTPDVVTILSAPTITPDDGYNSQIRDWDNATRTVSDAVVQSVSSTELLENGAARDQVTARFKVWLPSGTPVTSADRILWNDKTLAVDGLPQEWSNPYAPQNDHVALICLVSEG